MLSVAVDLNDESEQLKQYRNYQSFDYLKINSRSKEFASYCKNHFDLCLIDGDHSFEGVLSDFSLIRDSTKINVFHDITSKACPGTTNFWQLLKVFYGPDKHSIYEFTDQYEDTIDRGPFLGIGVVVHNDRL